MADPTEAEPVEAPKRRTFTPPKARTAPPAARPVDEPKPKKGFFEALEDDFRDDDDE